MQTKEGQEGWVGKQYLTSRIPKPVIIAELKKEINRLEDRIDLDEINTVRLRVNELERKSKNCREKLALTNLKLKQITAKYKGLIGQSDDVTDLKKRHDRLRTENDNLEREVENLERENAQLMFLRMLWWFLAGAGVFIVGLIVGKISHKKKIFY